MNTMLRVVARRIPAIIARRTQTTIAADVANPSQALADMKKLTRMDQRVMVWGGAFRNMSEVPKQVTRSQYVKAQERMRIKMNIIGIFATLAACGVMAFLGRRDAEKGYTYHQIVMDRHAKAQQEAALENPIARL